MKTVVFFSASKSQANYFSALCDFNSQEWFTANYKSIPFCISFPGIPFGPLYKNVKNDYIRRASGSNCSRKLVLFLFLPARYVEAYYLYAKYLCFLKTSNIKKSIIWNGLKFRQAIWVLSCKKLGIKTAYMENGLIRGMTTFDRKGVNYLNSVPRDSKFYKNLDVDDSCLIKTADLYRAKNADKELPSINKNYIFVPLQLDNDSQIAFFSPWIKSMDHFISILGDLQPDIERRGLCFLVKPHPLSKIKYSYKYKNLPDHIQFVEDVPTEDLIINSKAVLAINSTVGLESIILRKPVIVLGGAFYAISGLSEEVKNITELRSCLEKLPAVDINILKGFVSYLVEKYQVPGDWKSPSSEHLIEIKKRIDEL